MYTKQLAQLISTVCTGLLLSTSITWAEDKANEGISPQPLTSALAEFAEQSGLQLVYLTELAEGIETQGAQSTEMPERALDQLLADTGLRYEFVNDRTVSIEPQSVSISANLEPKGLGNSPAASTSVLTAQNQTPASQNQTSRSSQTRSTDDEPKQLVIEEIVVTGTRIRGLANTASPLVQFDRKDIDVSGAPTVADFIQRAVPQNFAAGAADQTFLVGRAAANSNVGEGTGVNLRGLGTDSTLILLNGRRMAASGSGTFVDVSMIPLAAVERVDILTDGASAIYGSDAVGGVVNFVLRDNYEGAETRLRFAPDLGSNFSEVQFGQTLGKAWNSGNLVASYEYNERDKLDSNDRRETANAPDPLDILPEQKRHSVFFSANQEISDRIGLFGTALFSDRNAVRNFFNLSSADPQQIDVDNQTTVVTGGASFDLAKKSFWRGEFSATYSLNEVDQQAIRFDGSEPGTFEQESDAWMLDATINGNLFNLAGGATKLAVGGQYREEALDTLSSGLAPSNLSRDAVAVFGELFVPLIGEGNARFGAHRLELTVAARYEDYSDFGDTTDPKVGLLYSPTSGFNLRGTWGTSFRAPLLDELDSTDTTLFLVQSNFPGFDPAAATPLRTIALINGKSPNLQPEEATTWTFGFDIQPESLHGFELGATYFDIDFEDRIVAPDIFGFVLPRAFLDPVIDPLISTSFDQAELDNLIAAALAFAGAIPNLTGGAATLGDVDTLLDVRPRNFAATNMTGLDMTTSYDFNTGSGDWRLSLAGTFLFDAEEQLIPVSPPEDFLGTIYNPPELRLRGGIAWSTNGLSANAFLNYVGGLDDERSDPVVSVDSFTTVDVQISLDFEEWLPRSFLSGANGYVAVTNIFGEEAPFVRDVNERNFDPENHSILGRVIAIGLTHQW